MPAKPRSTGRCLSRIRIRAHGVRCRVFLATTRATCNWLTWPRRFARSRPLPAQREHLTGRGLLKSGFYADLTIFDPAAIIDTATYANPNQVAKGVQYVFVNGQLELEQGRLTGATAGRALRGQGATQ